MDTSARVEIKECGRPLGALLVTPEQAAFALSICRTKVYELLSKGELESVRIGTSRRIPNDALAEYVQRLRESSRPGHYSKMGQ